MDLPLRSSPFKLLFGDIFNRQVINDLKTVLAHNRDEEKEHAAMVLEWVKRKNPAFDKELKGYPFSEKKIAHELEIPGK